MLKFYMKDVKKCQAHEWGPVMENSDKSDMTLKQWNKSSETATNNAKMGWDYDSDEEKGKVVVKMLSGTMLPPQSVESHVLKFRQCCKSGPIKRSSTKINMLMAFYVSQSFHS